MRKKVLITSLVIIACFAVGIYLYKKSNDKLDLPNSKGDVVIPETSEHSKKLKVKFYKLENDQTITEKELEINDKKPLIAFVDYMFNDYSTNADKGIINIPAELKVIDYKIEMGTLILNLNKEVKQVRFNDMTTEEIFLKSLLKSIGTVPSNGEFQDVQFLVEGSNDEAIFSSYPTQNPLKF
ncbi:MAG: GerMN domain-containing protein [Clostridium sp.]